MNLEDNNGNGSHWFCIFNSQDKYYFDSYGLPPPVEVMKFLQNGVYHTFQVQDLNSNYCGQLCLYVLFYLNNIQDFYNIIINLM